MTDFKNIDIKNLIDSGELEPMDNPNEKVVRLKHIDGTIYYLKKSGYLGSSWLKELLGERIAILLGNRSVHYDRVIFKDYDRIEKELKMAFKYDVCKKDDLGRPDIHFYGSRVISESFRKSKRKYINGNDIINPYIKSLSNSKLLEYYGNRYKHDILFNPNDLETIWNALEYRYKERKDRDRIVANLMNDFTQLYEFSILLGNFDIGKENYVIEETETDVKMMPFNDYEFIFPSEKELGVGLSVEEEDYDENFEVSLLKYLKYIPLEQRERFREKFEILTEEVISRIIDDIINKYAVNESERKLLVKRKQKILKTFKIHKNKIESVIYKNSKSM